MTIEYLQLYTAKAIRNLSDWWLFKLGVSSLLCVLQFHMTVFSLFVLLVIFDLSTKWIALARPIAREKTGKETPAILDEVKAIPEAHRRGIISSDVMKTRFICKILVYIVVVISAGTADMVLIELGKSDFLVTLAIGYLATSELLSIIENLDEAGVDGLHELITMIERNRGR